MLGNYCTRKAVISVWWVAFALAASKWLGLRRNQSVITLEVCDISLVS